MKRIAFLIHPRDVHDLYRRFPFLKILGDDFNEAVLKNLRFPKRIGFTICSKFDIYGQAEGYLIAVLLTAKQIMTDRESARKRILDALLYAQNKLGVELIGLGALTKSVTEGGRWLADNEKVRAKITNGDALTTAVALEAIDEIIKKKALRDPVIAIVGATGIIGQALSRLLISHKLILIGRNPERLKQSFPDLTETSRIVLSGRLSDAINADIIITATNHHDSFVKSEHLKRNAVVYDIAQPSNVLPDVIKERPDIVSLDGGHVSIPGINLKFNMGTPRGTTFACLAETILHALENDDKDYIGYVDAGSVKLIKERAKKHNFVHAPFTSCGKQINF